MNGLSLCVVCIFISVRTNIYYYFVYTHISRGRLAHIDEIYVLKALCVCIKKGYDEGLLLSYNNKKGFIFHFETHIRLKNWKTEEDSREKMTHIYISEDDDDFFLIRNKSKK